MIRGERQIKIHGEMVQIHAEVDLITNTSAHADAHELLAWCTQFKKPPKKIFITHGDADAAKALKQTLHEKLGWQCIVPHYQQTEHLV